MVDAGSDAGVGEACSKSCALGCSNGACVEIADVQLGAEHACVTLTDGIVVCWGENKFVQFGNEDVGRVTGPVEVMRLAPGERLSVGTYHACRWGSPDGTFCWGQNDYGQVGATGPEFWVAEHVQVPSVDSAIQVDVDDDHSCALLPGDEIWCWGRNEREQVADSGEPVFVQPTLFRSGQSFEAIALGDGITCARRADGTVICNQDDPSTLVDITSLTGGWDRACAVDAVGDVFCWGRIDGGVLGDGQPRARGERTPTPLRVSGLPKVTSVCAGVVPLCAITQAGLVFCWGDNSRGELGLGFASTVERPTEIPGLPRPIVHLDCQSQHVCAATRHEVFCWGDAGDSFDTVSTPTKIDLASALSVGGDF